METAGTIPAAVRLLDLSRGAALLSTIEVEVEAHFLVPGVVERIPPTTGMAIATATAITTDGLPVMTSPAKMLCMATVHGRKDDMS